MASIRSNAKDAQGWRLDVVKVRVRGICSTALAKLLLESGHQIVQPSKVQEKRNNVKEDWKPYDLDVNDRPDYQGIHALGKTQTIDVFDSVLRSQLQDVILRRWNVAVEGIYKGLIKLVDEEQGLAQVDIGPTSAARAYSPGIVSIGD